MSGLFSLGFFDLVSCHCLRLEFCEGILFHCPESGTYLVGVEPYKLLGIVTQSGVP